MRVLLEADEIETDRAEDWPWIKEWSSVLARSRDVELRTNAAIRVEGAKARDGGGPMLGDVGGPAAEVGGDHGGEQGEG